ncbi:MAG: UDP-N-acetylmuramate--L-alanine ligase [Deltaproteobacteria bacterium]|nr:UDP-N-acetylmuramate--L-alanine ligase [Deltaproteobacteria bacterium]
MDVKLKKIHFIGIGGIGMSGIAEVLLNLGYKITGSDLNLSPLVKRLQSLGATVFQGHNEKNVYDQDLVVTSTAVSSDNPEVLKAKKLKIPVVPRAQMLSELMNMKEGIAISGMHGKTTTTSLTAMVFEHAGLDPTAIVGGRVKGIGSNAKLGKGKYLIAEADESDKSFLKLNPKISVVTNIDLEHMDHYRDLKDIQDTYVSFLNRVPEDGLIVACGDDAHVVEILPRLKKKYVTYGMTNDCDYTVKNIKHYGTKSYFDFYHHKKKIGEIVLSIPGDHNILNSLATIIVALECGIAFSEIKKSLSEFHGVERRFQTKGEKEGILVMDDYGHHPTEISVTLKTFKDCWPERRLVVLFQPHRFTRTKDLFKEFGKAFFCADKLLVIDIYAASEKPIQGIHATKLVEEINKNSHNAEYVGDLQNALEVLKGLVQKNDIVLTLGAGNIYQIGEKFLDG